MEPTLPGRGHDWPRQCRLRSKARIRVLFTRGQAEAVRVQSVLLLFSVVPRNSGAFQAGFAVPRCAKAVQRNRVKRIMRETVRRHQELLQLPEGTLIFMAVYRGSLPVDADQLRTSLKAAMLQMHNCVRI